MSLAMSPRSPGGWFRCCWLLLGAFSRSGWQEHPRDQYWSRASWDMSHVAIPLNPAVLPGYLVQCELPKDILVEYRGLLSNKELEFLFYSFYISSWHFPLPPPPFSSPNFASAKHYLARRLIGLEVAKKSWKYSFNLTDFWESIWIWKTDG